MRIPLGDITCPSGELVVVDAGYLRMWSGDRSPATLDPAVVPLNDRERSKDAITRGVDFDVAGPDAEAAAGSFDRQAGLTLYDIPGDHAGSFRASFREHCRTEGFDAELVARQTRVPHRERARRAAAAGGQEFVVFGLPVVAVGGLPVDRPLPVEGVLRNYGDPVGTRWEQVRVIAGTGSVARTAPIGDIGVDWARFLLGDAEALGSWRHDESVDGLADVVLRGADAAAAAAAHHAAPLTIEGEDRAFGWANLDGRDAADRARAVENWIRADPARKLTVDVRPHSHDWRVMREVRSSPHRAGTVLVGGARMLCAMTSWGDGIFGVHADYDAAGGLVAVRLVLGDDRRRRRLAALAATMASAEIAARNDVRGQGTGG